MSNYRWPHNLHCVRLYTLARGYGASKRTALRAVRNYFIKRIKTLLTGKSE